MTMTYLTGCDEKYVDNFLKYINSDFENSVTNWNINLVKIIKYMLNYPSYFLAVLELKLLSNMIKSIIYE